MTDTTATASAVKAPAPAKAGKGATVGIVVSAIVAAIGIALWMVQLSGGMVQTAMRNLDSWGLYITMFMFFVGLSAGGLIISSVPKAFGIKGFGGISKVAVMTSIAATVAAIGFVVVDLGQPLRVWELFAYSNLGSPLMWDIIVLMVYLILSCVYLWAQVGNEKGKVSHAALRVISVVALVCADPRALRDRLDLRPAAVPRDVAHGAAGPLVRVLGARVRHRARDVRRRGPARGRVPQVGPVRPREAREAARRVPARGPLLLRLRPPDRGLPGRLGRRRGGDAGLGPLGPLLLGRDRPERGRDRAVRRARPAHHPADGRGRPVRHRRHLLPSAPSSWWAVSSCPTSTSRPS